ncbi:MAG: hypothetical protein IT376_03295 [Polyangiaceae bacterium]|nr:hypothetical protein [Polyangiaceae bacterium]
MRIGSRLAPGALLVLSVACGGGEDGAAPAPAYAPPADGLPAACHPLRSAGACSVPWPSAHALREDPTTATGYRVALAPEGMPASAAGGPLEVGPWNRLDGFSPATPIVAWFPERLDVASLPSQRDLPASQSGTSATLLLEFDTGELLPHFAELDMSADIVDDERQPMMIRPARHLTPGARYAVAVTRRVRALGGGEPTSPEGFQQALRGAESSDPAVRAALADAREAADAFAPFGVGRDDLLLAWTFRTASLAAITAPVLAMRDVALAAAGESGTGYVIETVEDAPRPEVWKRVRGTYTVTSFLTTDSRTEPEAVLQRDVDGTPQARGPGQFPFDLIIPASAATSPAMPLLIYGHGLLGSALDGFSGHVRQFCNDKQWVCIGTDFIGLSEAEAAGVGSNAAALDAIKDVSKLPWLTDRMQQALVNTLVLVRAARAILADPRTFVDTPGGTRSAHDPSLATQYYGISQGGIFGASFLGYSPDVARGVLQVGGSGFSLFVQRSVNWNEFFPAIRNGYPDRVDQQVVLALWQALFDHAEGAGTAWAQGTHDPLPGVPRKALLFQIAVGDSQVPNLGSEIQARTLGTPLLVPSAREVWGLETTPGGGDLAMVYWDLQRTPPPETNETPVGDNDVHGDIRKLSENQLQTDTFLRTGRVEATCSGPCTFPDAP